MDKGAHFFKCDFQVHTPRDINWNGASAVSDEERKAYAEELVLACREKGINAIAITDHHDLLFFKYVKDAAKNERDNTGNYYDERSQLVVFPGMELTFSNPASCQAILLLDAGITEEFFVRIMNKLSLTPSVETSRSTAETVPISGDTVAGLEDLYLKLDTVDGLKGKYIILPNLSDGHGGILRRGFYEHYKKMPCVGGYVDGALPTDAGFLSKINGKDRNYGFKSVAVFQTSDNRHRDHSVLGTFASWVKWAVPTAEAIRQACLARESRISQEPPVLPAIFVTSIDVSSSKFMGQFDCEFNRQYNAIIGGRGTGKSTILEYLRWGLCDQIYSADEGYEESKSLLKSRSLIEKTLTDSTVQVAFIKNNIPHIVRRKIKSNEISLKIGSGEFALVTEENIRGLLPIQAYSQKQLSTVGVRVEELKRLVYSPIRQELNDFSIKFDELKADIRRCYELKLRKKQTEAEIEKSELELKSLEEQVESLREGLKGISDEDKAIISSHKQYEIIEQLVEGWRGELSSARQVVENMKREILSFPSKLSEDVKLSDEEQPIIADIHSELKNIFESINLALSAIDEQLDTKGAALVKLNALLDKSSAIFERHRKNYEAAKQKSTSQEASLTQIQKLESRTKEIRKFLNEKKQGISKAGDPDAQFNVLKETWVLRHKERADLLSEQCAKLSTLSDDNLRSILGRGKGTTELENVLKKMIEGSGAHKTKIEELCKRIAGVADPVQEWGRILSEFEVLANLSPSTNPTAPLTGMPTLVSIFTENALKKIAEKITCENWIELFLTQLDDVPIFEYKTGDNQYIPFNDASAGQQATALMHVLLNQDGPPLIIDQPEDDLDNQMVSEIAALIWKAKKKRQLIFASHNANIVVNGDAELVVCCDYKITTDQSKGAIKNLGAIDIDAVRNEITKVMEGGEVAFKLRKEKYGF